MGTACATITPFAPLYSHETQPLPESWPGEISGAHQPIRLNSSKAGPVDEHIPDVTASVYSHSKEHFIAG